MGRSRIISQPADGRGREDQVVNVSEATQPSFVQNLLGRFGRNNRGTLVTVKTAVSEGNRYGDIRAEDIFPESIRNIHVRDLSADKLTAGTISTGDITIESDDGKMYLDGNIFAVDNATDVRQITIGKYDGTNYGIAIGTNPNDPDVLLDEDGLTIRSVGVVNFLTGADALFQNAGATLNSVIGYVSNNFVIIGDATNGINLFGNGGNISLGETSGSYGGGSKVVFIPNASANPTTNPTGGGILYSNGGALTWRGSAGTVTAIAPA